MRNNNTLNTLNILFAVKNKTSINKLIMCHYQYSNEPKIKRTLMFALVFSEASQLI